MGAGAAGAHAAAPTGTHARPTPDPRPAHDERRRFELNAALHQTRRPLRPNWTVPDLLLRSFRLKTTEGRTRTLDP